MEFYIGQYFLDLVQSKIFFKPLEDIGDKTYDSVEQAEDVVKTLIGSTDETLVKLYDYVHIYFISKEVKREDDIIDLEMTFYGSSSWSDVVRKKVADYCKNHEIPLKFI